jgi:hypothetical protein
MKLKEQVSAAIRGGFRTLNPLYCNRCIELYNAVLYCIVIVLYCIALYCIVLYCVCPHHSLPLNAAQSVSLTVYGICLCLAAIRFWMKYCSEGLRLIGQTTYRYFLSLSSSHSHSLSFSFSMSLFSPLSISLSCLPCSPAYSVRLSYRDFLHLY